MMRDKGKALVFDKTYEMWIFLGVGNRIEGNEFKTIKILCGF